VGHDEQRGHAGDARVGNMAPVKRPFRVRRRTYFREWREAVVPLLSRNSPNRSIPPIFLGSKADATFCLAMISIRSGMKPR
jgi:hypothetical protein